VLHNELRPTTLNASREPNHLRFSTMTIEVYVGSGPGLIA
jgi:hypothetical protein